MLCSRQTSKTAWPLSAARKMRILSSVVYRLPFILDPFSWPQTNTTSGSKKRGHVRRIGAAEFGEFLKRLMQGAKRPIFLVVDCHSIHRSQQVRHLLQRLKGRLRLFYLPPYSPELNPDELVWNGSEEPSCRENGAARTRRIEVCRGLTPAVPAADTRINSLVLSDGHHRVRGRMMSIQLCTP